MTKAELIKKMAKEAEISEDEAKRALESFMREVQKVLMKDEDDEDCKVTLVGFGTFSKSRRKARVGRNPRTGEPIKIKARSVVKFKAGKRLADAV